MTFGGTCDFWGAWAGELRRDFWVLGPEGRGVAAQLSRVDLRLRLLSSIIGLSRNRCWWHRLVSLGSLKKKHYNTLNPKNPKP